MDAKSTIHFMECFKTAQKQVYKKKHEYGKYLWCVSLLGAIFLDFCDASTSMDNEIKVQEINLSGNPCAPDTNPPVVKATALSIKQLPMLCLPFWAIQVHTRMLERLKD